MKNIDIRKTLDIPKIMLYHEWLATHIYDEGESGFHKQLTTKVTETYFDSLELAKDARILDLGCGPGYFLDEIKQRGYTNYLGVTLSQGDIDLCKSKGHDVEAYDLSFLPQHKGFHDESVDFIFLRHALEHSPYPLFTLAEYNRIMKQNAIMYIEVPAPDCERGHEFNLNHYSIFGERMLAALLQRTGFAIQKFDTLEFDLNMGSAEEGSQDTKRVRERFFCLAVKKVQSLDLK